MTDRVRGKVALITGAAHGQGAAHARALAREGADLILVDACAGSDPLLGYPLATVEELEATAAEARELGARVVTAVCDVRDAAGLQKACADGVAELGGLDVVVANAGINTLQRWDEATDELWRMTLDVNVMGVWNTCSAALPHLIDRGSGSIVVISSVAGLKGYAFQQPYVASKHAVLGIARSLAHEFADRAIRVNSVHPTGVHTPMVSGAQESVGAMLAEHPTAGAMYMNSMPVQAVDPEDIAAAVLFLASDESRYVTGIALPVDAGASRR